MGIFDKLKSAAKFVTGGGAKVTLVVEEASLLAPFKAKIHAEVSDTDLKINQVYLHVRASERVTVPVRENASAGDSEPGDSSPVGQHREVSEEVQTFRQEFQVSGPEELKANGSYDWEFEVTLPSGINPSYYGRNAFHRWYFMAGLDARGNDPDSGWVEVRI